MLIHFPVDPVFSIEKWCKAWKLQERVSLDVGIQTVMHVEYPCMYLTRKLNNL